MRRRYSKVAPSQHISGSLLRSYFGALIGLLDTFARKPIGGEVHPLEMEGTHLSCKQEETGMESSTELNSVGYVAMNLLNSRSGWDSNIIGDTNLPHGNINLSFQQHRAASSTLALKGIPSGALSSCFYLQLGQRHPRFGAGLVQATWGCFWAC